MRTDVELTRHAAASESDQQSLGVNVSAYDELARRAGKVTPVPAPQQAPEFSRDGTPFSADEAKLAERSHSASAVQEHDLIKKQRGVRFFLACRRGGLCALCPQGLADC